MSHRVHLIEQSLRAGPPHRLVEILARQLDEHLGASDTDLLMVDYRLVRLTGVLSGDPSVPVAGTCAGRTFASQEPQVEHGSRVYVPATNRGERQGVLVTTLPERPTPEVLAELVDLGAALAHALQVAERETDRYQPTRRRSRLTLAAEMQWELLPGRSCNEPGFELAGQLEPAYAVCGDNFDWASDPSKLTLAVTNGMGDGLRASLLTSLAVNAIRNARRSGASLTEQASLADEAVYAMHGGKTYVESLLLQLDIASGQVTAVDAGSPSVLRLRDSVVEPMELEKQLPLGMFGSTDYVEQTFELRPGDRLLIASDGMGQAENPSGEAYGTGVMIRTIKETRLQPPAEVVRSLTHAMLVHRDGSDLVDDAVIVCLRWTGPPAVDGRPAR